MAVCCMLACSCDEISQEERLVYVPQPLAERAVLVEDFTGQRCVNCPSMTEALAKYADNYGHDKVIVVAHHSGSFSNVPASWNKLRSEESQQYFKSFNVLSQPAVVINHGGPIINIESELGKPLANALSAKTPVTIEGKASIEDSNIKVDAKLTTLENISNTSVMVWVLENNIKATQLLGDNTIDSEYIHNHVFRKSITPLEGEVIGNMVADVSVERNYSVALDENWDNENLEIVIVAMKNDIVENVLKVKVSNN